MCDDKCLLIYKKIMNKENCKNKNTLATTIVELFLYSIPLIIFIALNISRNNNEFLSSFNGSILIISFLFIFFIGIIFVRKKQLQLLVSLYLLISSFSLCYLHIFLLHRYYILILVLLSLIGFTFYLFPKKFERELPFTLIFSLFLIIPVLKITIKITSINKVIPFLIAIPLCLLIGSIIIFLFIRKHQKILEKSKSETHKKKNAKQIAVFSITTIGIYLITYTFSFVVFISLNYALDFNESKMFTSQVLEKKRIRHVRSFTYYMVKIEYDNKEYEVGIPYDIFMKIDVGDDVELSYSYGLFSLPYIIHPRYI